MEETRKIDSSLARRRKLRSWLGNYTAPVIYTQKILGDLLDDVLRLNPETPRSAHGLFMLYFKELNAFVGHIPTSTLDESTQRNAFESIAWLLAEWTLNGPYFSAKDPREITECLYHTDPLPILGNEIIQQSGNFCFLVASTYARRGDLKIISVSKVKALEYYGMTMDDSHDLQSEKTLLSTRIRYFEALTCLTNKVIEQMICDPVDPPPYAA